MENQTIQLGKSEERFYLIRIFSIKKVEYNTDGSNITTLYINDNFIHVINSTGETYNETYYYHEGQLIAKKNNTGGKLFYHPDHLGSTNLVTNESGAVVEYTTYKPYGDVYEGGDSRYLFTGKEKDRKTGLDYFGARYYSSSRFMHFTQADPVFYDLRLDNKRRELIYNPQALNPYSYVLNNPYKYIDLEGEAIFDPNAPGDPASFLQVINQNLAVYLLRQEQQKLAQKQLEFELRKEFGDLPKVQTSNIIGAYDKSKPSPAMINNNRYTFYQLQEMKLSKSFSIETNQYQDVIGYIYEGKPTSVGLLEKRGFEKSIVINEISSEYQQKTGRTYERSSIKRTTNRVINIGSSIYSTISKWIGGSRSTSKNRDNEK